MLPKFGITVDKQTVIAYKKIQIEAVRIVTGSSTCATIDSIYRETGWET
jgi:hypothetical protein